MKRQRFVCLLCILLMALSLTDSVAQGLFPSFSNIFTQLPSLSAIVKRRADSEEKLADGRRQVTYNNITSQDFDSFSKYIAEYGCEMVDYSSDALHFTATIRYKDAEFVFDYDFNQYKAVITYPTNANEEKIELATPTPEPTRKPTATPTKAPTKAPTKTPTRRPTATPTKRATARPTATPQRVSLIIPSGGWGTWQKVSSKRIGFKFEVKNMHPSKTVHDFDVIAYTCDEFGKQNSAKDVQNVETKIRPYEKLYSGLIYLPNPSQIYTLHVAIRGVRYTDGSTEYTSDPEFFTWTLKK